MKSQSSPSPKKKLSRRLHSAAFWILAIVITTPSLPGTSAAAPRASKAGLHRSTKPAASMMASARATYRTAQGGPINALSKEARHQRMADIESRLALLRVKIAANPQNEAFALEAQTLRRELDSLSATLGGDRPANERAAAPPAQPSGKDAAHDRMRDLDAQISELRRLAAQGHTSGIENQLAGLLAEYEQLSASLGGDRAVQLDQTNRPHIVPTPPAGCSVTTTTFSNMTPLPIPDSPGGPVMSTIMVSGAGTSLWDLDLTTNITHTFAADLDITITSPSGTVVTLTTDNGGGNDDVFAGTLWDDSAGNDTVTDHAYTNLVVATPLVPEGAFGAFIGEDPNGTWTLTLADDAGIDTGTLNSWSIGVSSLPSAPTLSAPATFSNMTPLPIPDSPGGPVMSTIMVSGLDTTLGDLNLTTNITHTFAADLDITITSPSGTVVTLTTDNGGGNDDVFAGTLWDDSAGNDTVTDHTYTNLVVATPLVPEGAFGAFIGEDPNGTWTLTLADDAGIDTGTLNSWSLDIATATCGGGGGPCVPSTSMTFSNMTPLPIPDSPGGPVMSTIMVSGLDTYLADLNLTTNITHTFAADLDITITSPSGTVVTLTTDNGGGNDDVFAGTLWDDSAGNDTVTDHTYTNLVVATPLVPEGAFGAFIGEDPNGTWTLTLADDAGIDTGTLNSWAVSISTFPIVPTGVTTTFSNMTPLPIPDSPGGPVMSTIMVSGLDTTLGDLNLTTNITHTFAADLDITITSPSGTVVTLTTDNGGGNDDVFAGTLWDDSAGNDTVTDHTYTNLVVATPLVPEGAFGAFIGEDPNGTWTLTLADDAGIDTGTLNSWSLDITTITCGGGGGGVVFDFCAFDDNTGDSFSIVTDPLSPDFGYWEYNIAATSTVLSGIANFVYRIPDIKLRAYDNDYSAENPIFFMDATFGRTSGTVYIRSKSGVIIAVLRDRNLLNNPPCN